jgi:RND family efflux transporter MFP subunit
LIFVIRHERVLLGQAGREPPMRNKGLKMRLFATITIAVAASLAACDKQKSQSDSDAARPVLVTQVHYSTQAQAREFVASIRPRVETDLGFRVAGKVMRRLVDVGRRVKAGDPVALLDETDLRLQKEQSEAELSAARMALEQASADERRSQKLRADGWTAQAALDRSRAAAQEARGRMQRATRAVELSGNSLDYATLRADADGVVTATFVEPGQVVASGQTAVRIARAGEMEAQVALPESFISIAGAGDAKLVLWSRPDKAYRAHLRELSPSADAATRTFPARFSILDADASVSLGMSATLTIASADRARAVSVPLAAVFNQGGGAGLWKVDGEGRLTLVPVTVLRYESAAAVVSGDLAEGDNIVALGVQKLDAKQKVRVVTLEQN